MKRVILPLLLMLWVRAEAVTELRGFLSHAGRPLTAEIDLAVLVYLDRRDGAFIDRRLFASVAVREGRFAIDLDLSRHRQRPLFLEFRLRRNGRDEAFEVLRPRQLVLPYGSGWVMTAPAPDQTRWSLRIDRPKWS